MDVKDVKAQVEKVGLLTLLWCGCAGRLDSNTFGSIMGRTFEPGRACERRLSLTPTHPIRSR